jgi:hypothetical protein
LRPIRYFRRQLLCLVVLIRRCRPCASNSLTGFGPAFAALHSLSVNTQRPHGRI